MKFSCWSLGLGAALFISAMGCKPARAEGEGDEIRYDLFKMEDGSGRYRFDRKTGDVERLVRDGNGFEWVRVVVRQSSKAPSPAGENSMADGAKSGAPQIPPSSQAGQAPRENTSMANLSEPKKKSEIKLFNDQGDDITDAITDFDRKRNEAEIASYESKLSMPHTIQIGDRVTGTILLRNTGDRKLKQLEVSLFIPVIGKEKPEVSRFLFCNKIGSISPPQPSSEPLIQKVDIPSPGGSGKAMPELRVTYLKFED